MKPTQKEIDEWKEEVQRYPLLCANYNNCKHLLVRDNCGDEPPQHPGTIEEFVKRKRTE